MVINASAQQYEPTQVWISHGRQYVTAHTNRKRAINWALAKIEAEFPGFTTYEAIIIED